ncbi:Trehalose 6-phosphate phosphorylase [Diplonema papillatum]|nr:Trehalose 6-phosphate phosphorylase [Diplonema papillatum]
MATGEESFNGGSADNLGSPQWHLLTPLGGGSGGSFRHRRQVSTATKGVSTLLTASPADGKLVEHPETPMTPSDHLGFELDHLEAERVDIRDLGLYVKAAIIDLDTLIPHKELTHASAEAVFNGYFKENGKVPIDATDHREFATAPAREQGVLAALARRGLELPWGSPRDSGYSSISGIDSLLQKEIAQRYATTHFAASQPMVAFLKSLQANGLKLGAVSTCECAVTMLEKCKLAYLFQCVVDLKVIWQYRHRPKPAPDVFLHAVYDLGVAASEAIVIESSGEGVQAAREGNFGLVIAVTQSAQAGSEDDSGIRNVSSADFVTDDPRSISIATILEWFLKGVQKDSWKMTFNNFSAPHEAQRETLTTVGNGYFSSRGCSELHAMEFDASGSLIHYPGHYINGIYSRTRSQVDTEWVENTDLVNCPNWSYVRVMIGDPTAPGAAFFDPHHCEILEYAHQLNLHDAVLERSITVRDEKGRISRIESARIVSMDLMHVAALSFTFTPINYSDTVTIRSGVDANVENALVKRYRGLQSKHLTVIGSGRPDKLGPFYILTKIAEPETVISTAVKHNVTLTQGDKTVVVKSERFSTENGVAYEEFTATVGVEGEGEGSFQVDKIVSVYTSKDSYDESEKELPGLSRRNSSLLVGKSYLHRPSHLAKVRGHSFNQLSPSVALATVLEKISCLSPNTCCQQARRSRGFNARASKPKPQSPTAKADATAAAKPKPLDPAAVGAADTVPDACAHCGRPAADDADLLENSGSLSLPRSETDTAALTRTSSCMAKPVASPNGVSPLESGCSPVRGLPRTRSEGMSSLISFTKPDDADEKEWGAKTVGSQSNPVSGSDSTEDPPEVRHAALVAASLHILQDLASYHRVLEPHRQAWEDVWESSDMQIEGDRACQRITRIHTYNLFVTASPFILQLDTGILARGLHGEAHRGHVFWDEVYSFPYYLSANPDICRAHLLYRSKRLKAAREEAKARGYKGAMYPWQTADTGKEVTQQWHYNPLSKKWHRDYSSLQKHINIAIFYDAWLFNHRVRDEEFIPVTSKIMFSIALFWSSISDLGEDGRYHIRKTMGPDEFHDASSLKNEVSLEASAKRLRSAEDTLLNLVSDVVLSYGATEPFITLTVTDAARGFPDSAAHFATNGQAAANCTVRLFDFDIDPVARSEQVKRLIWVAEALSEGLHAIREDDAVKKSRAADLKTAAHALHDEISSDSLGVSDNAYTNVMVVWLLRQALELLDAPGFNKKVLAASGVSADDVAKWRVISNKMYVSIDDTGVVEQFKGFFDLPPLDIDKYKHRYKDLSRMDLVLQAEGESAANYQVLKQADTLMLWYLLTTEEVYGILKSLGYLGNLQNHVVDESTGKLFDATELLRRNRDYYVPKTNDGSSLSYMVHAHIAGELGDYTEQWSWYTEAARTDIYNKSGTTGEGIHCSVMAGSLTFVATWFVGLREGARGVWTVAPNLPAHWSGVTLRQKIQGYDYWIRVNPTEVKLRLEGDVQPNKPLVTFKIAGTEVRPGPWSMVSVQHDSLCKILEFYELMRHTLHHRKVMCNNYFLGGILCDRKQVEVLRHAHRILRDLPKDSRKKVKLWLSSGTRVECDLTYEIVELEKDICLIDRGEQVMVDTMVAPGVSNFAHWVSQGVAFLSDLNLLQVNWLTDRDGTTNNYCGRYNSSVQSVYNSIWITRFALCCRRAVFITSAPLANPGIINVSVNFEHAFVYSGSKGKEYLDFNGVRRTKQITEAEQRKMHDLNTKLSNLCKQPEYSKFTLIGSGLQLKFAQTTVARQDIYNTIRRKESNDFLKVVTNICNEVSRGGFEIIDTGLDIEVMPKEVDSTETRGFDKGDGLVWLDAELNLGLEKGINLITGDTSGDVPMVREAMKACPDRTFVIFVTKDKTLQQEVSAMCPRSIFLPTPDVLCYVLSEVAKVCSFFCISTCFVGNA